MHNLKQLLLFSLIILTACGPASAATSAPVTDTFLPTRQVTLSPTNTTTPLPPPTITPTQQPVYKIEPLLTGQYLVYVDECDPTDITSLCSLHVISLDGSVDQFLVRGLPAGEFVYRNGFLASTMNYWDQSGQHFRIQVLDIQSGKVVEIPKPAERECLAEDWSPDASQLLVVCRKDGMNFEIGLIDIQNGKYTLLLQDLNENGNSDGYESTKWSPDGKWISFYRLYSKSPKGVEGWYFTDMSCVSEPSTCQAKTRRLPVEKLEGERGNRIISWTTESNLARAIDNRIEVYDVNNGQRIHTFELDPAGGDIYSMAWSPDGNWVVVDQLDSPGALAIPVKGGEPIFINKGIVNPFWITKP